jgi:hypothetical protein
MKKPKTHLHSSAALGLMLTLLLLIALPAVAAPPIGHTVSGTVRVDGTAVNAKELTIRVSGVVFTTTTTASGFYGYTIPGDDPDTASTIEGGKQDDAVAFALDGVELVETVAWSAGADTTLNLSNATLVSTTTLPISGTTEITFTMANGAPGTTIDPAGEDLGSTQVRVRANQDCTTVPNETVRRCFRITVTNPPSGPVPITFFFTENQIPTGQTCAAMEVYHWTGSDWEKMPRDTTYAVDGRDCTTDPHAIRVKVDSFSPYVIKNGDAPTAVRLAAFSGQASNGGEVTYLFILAAILFSWIGLRTLIRHQSNKES